MRPGITQPRLVAGTTTTVVVGAGHAGLAMSQRLSTQGIDHVLLERGEIANAWRHERWDSLRLLTPNWQTRLPGMGYQGDDPDGFMTMPEVVDFIAAYARRIDAPVRTGVTVTAVRVADGGFRVETDQGDWLCRTVVMANGAFALPAVPALAAALPSGIDSITAREYRRPGQLADGGVLVVGASATGLQLADEIHRSGRPVVLAVGEHVRMPRRYRGADIQRWMDATGVLDERYDQVDDLLRARRVPSPQLVGTRDGSTLDLNALSARGIELVGRLAGLRDGTLQFSGSLNNVCALADLKQARLLDSIDRWAADPSRGHHELVPSGPPERFEPTRVSRSPRLSLDLDRGQIRTVVWATGFRPDYRCLPAAAFDAKGRLQHDGGVVAVPGIYVMGLPFLRRRKSSFIHGAGDDARELCDHLVAHLGCRSAAAFAGADAPRRVAGA
jgi:putative flavoprotein involved in K+ transport